MNRKQVQKQLLQEMQEIKLASKKAEEEMRQDALTWWRSMDVNQQLECCNTFGETFGMVGLTGFQIERLYRKVLKVAAMTVQQ